MIGIARMAVPISFCLRVARFDDPAIVFEQIKAR